MFIVKAITVLAAAFLSMLAIRHVAAVLEASRARVRAQPRRPPKDATRLRQDPRTGIYHPEK
ncbi:MAG: hypothetical protein HY245_13170 [Rhizobiales bacterium]|nr:hypothetical protein [Hyphomicrobiales bacterium]MBI3674341.1 hypothetical protein [Hyphomicrobiales bacterium]